jgi:hypothetical protein
VSIILREPKNNAYGRFRVLVRTDGLFIVFDPDEWPPTTRTFRSEADARTEALHRVTSNDPSYVHPREDVSMEDIREWIASRPHVAWCGCPRCLKRT